jgi:hypothetical protein
MAVDQNTTPDSVVVDADDPPTTCCVGVAGGGCIPHPLQVIWGRRHGHDERNALLLNSNHDEDADGETVAVLRSSLSQHFVGRTIYNQRLNRSSKNELYGERRQGW